MVDPDGPSIAFNSLSCLALIVFGRWRKSMARRFAPELTCPGSWSAGCISATAKIGASWGRLSYLAYFPKAPMTFEHRRCCLAGDELFVFSLRSKGGLLNVPCSTRMMDMSQHICWRYAEAKKPPSGPYCCACLKGTKHNSSSLDKDHQVVL